MFNSAKDLDEFFQRMELMSRQMAAVFGEGSDAFEAVKTYDEAKRQGKDVVIVFSNNNWAVGRRPSWKKVQKAIKRRAFACEMASIT